MSGSGLLDGADDEDGDGLSVVEETVTTAEGGSVTLYADGSFDYTPASGFSGEDSFGFTIDDGRGGQASATAYVTVHAPPVNHDPTSTDPTYETDQDMALNGSGLLDGATDLDNDELAVVEESTTTTHGGNATLYADGSFYYSPPSGFSGEDSFGFTVDDGRGGQVSATAYVTVHAPEVNHDPTATDQFYETDQEMALSDSGLLDGADDEDGDVLNAVEESISTAQGGVATIFADGSFDYTPPAGFSGEDSFVFTVDDSRGGQASATAYVTVHAPNQDPTASDQAYETDQDAPLNGSGLLDGADDEDGDGLSVVEETVSTAEGGSVTLYADGSFDYTPASGFSGEDSFGFTIDDGRGGQASATAYVTVHVVNQDPTASDQTYETDQDAPLSGSGLLDGADDEDGDGLSVVEETVTTAEGGSVTLYADGSFDYTPASGFSGEDSFGFTIDDGRGGQASATAYVTVHAPPVITSFDMQFLPVGESLWQFSGHVTGSFVAGATVVFGGELEGMSATVEADGSFGIAAIFLSDTYGVATAVVTDTRGTESNMMSCFVEAIHPTE